MAEAADSQAPGSLRRRAISGTIATLAGFGASQVLRLGSNLVLSRLLFPKAFGLMAVVALFMQGLAMFSDIGITPAIVQHKDGAQESFLNTAWTMQVMRGFALWICLALLAYPVSLFYQEPELRYLLPAVGLNAVITGFRSTAVATLNRKLMLGRLTIVDLVAQAVSVAAMVSYALLHKSVWALVVGSVVGSFVSVVLSHVVLPGIRHRLHWERGSSKELFKFGRWVTLSTAFSFLASQGDRAILSTFVSLTMIGVYSVAANLQQTALGIFNRLGDSVLFPMYATWGREDPAKLKAKLRQVRIKTLWWFMLPPCGMAILGAPVVRLLYDARYHEAAWMLPLMGVSLLLHVLVITIDPILLATGDSFRHMLVTIAKGLMVFLAMVIGGHVDGVRGVLLGSIAGRALQYPLVALAIRSKGAWTPWIDLIGVTASAVLIVGARALLGHWVS
ncbi:MAG TPA: oligosaccharide flippase family protein [Polyangiaceae bacterium]|nr:oligosaccharide flippase family protein [Polyangiaceae bacterium]